MIKFALKGNKSKQVHTAISSTGLDIKGCFHFTGRQIVGGEGGAPDWVYELFESDKDIESISINRKSSGVIYAPVRG